MKIVVTPLLNVMWARQRLDMEGLGLEASV
jgi:hypothetical protein